MLDDPELLAGFLDESSQNLQQIEPDLLTLEQAGENVEPDVVNRIFRSVHSIKGGAGFFGLKNIGQLAHEMESLLALVRDGKVPVTQTLVDVSFAGFDTLNRLFEDVTASDDEDISQIIQRIESYREDLLAGRAGEEPKAAEARPEPAPAEESSPQAAPAEATAPEGGEKPKKKVKKVKKVKRVKKVKKVRRDAAPEAAEESEAAPEKPVKAEPAREKPAASVTDAAGRGDTVKASAGDLGVKPEARKQPDKPAPAGEKKPEADKGEGGAGSAARKKILTDEKIRVSVTLLNELVDLAGELVLARNQLAQATMQHQDTDQGLGHAAQQISWATSEIQEKIMHLRMQPISVLFNRFPRTVRDLSREFNKDIRLETSGEGVELDKSIIEALVDPMTHLVRNSVDHGVESPDEREAAGKPRQGFIRFEAYHEGGQVHINVRDDGKGIDPDRVAQKALEKGLIKESDLKTMSEREKQRLIFAPGFSTTEAVTKLSGRGVGMDVVQTNIQALGGSVDIESAVGKGTRFGLVLPLTLAIVRGLVVIVRDQRFIVPQANIVELVRLRQKELLQRVNRVQNVQVLRLRDQLLPVLNLDQALELKRSHEASNFSSDGSAHFVILRVGSSLFAVRVDSVETMEEIVVKPLPVFFQRMAFFSGATVLGDGTVGLILDAAGLADHVGVKEFEDSVADRRLIDEEEQDTRERIPLLLFDNGTRERLALPLVLISRIEKIRMSEIEWINKKPFYQYRGDKLQLVMLEDWLPVTRPERQEDQEVSILIPKGQDRMVGIVFQHIVDSIDAVVELDTKSIQAPGLFGSAVLSGHITLIPNLYELFSMVFGEGAAAHKDEEEGQAVKGRRILVVDDTPFFRMVEKDYLESAGFRVDVAEDGEEALAKLTAERFDAVLLDIVMPRKDGWETVEEIRSRSELADLPVIAVTSLADDESRTKGRTAGFDAWEVKLDKQSIVKKLNKFLRDREAAEA